MTWQEWAWQEWLQFIAATVCGYGICIVSAETLIKWLKGGGE